MKTLVYVFVFMAIVLSATSCTDENVKPLGEDDPILVPPPPPKNG